MIHAQAFDVLIADERVLKGSAIQVCSYKCRAYGKQA